MRGLSKFSIWNIRMLLFQLIARLKTRTRSKPRTAWVQPDLKKIGDYRSWWSAADHQSSSFETPVLSISRFSTVFKVVQTGDFLAISRWTDHCQTVTLFRWSFGRIERDWHYGSFMMLAVRNGHGRWQVANLKLGPFGVALNGQIPKPLLLYANRL